MAPRQPSWAADGLRRCQGACCPPTKDPRSDIDGVPRRAQGGVPVTLVIEMGVEGSCWICRRKHIVW